MRAKKTLSADGAQARGRPTTLGLLYSDGRASRSDSAPAAPADRSPDRRSTTPMTPSSRTTSATPTAMGCPTGTYGEAHRGSVGGDVRSEPKKGVRASPRGGIPAGRITLTTTFGSGATLQPTDGIEVSGEQTGASVGELQEICASPSLSPSLSVRLLMADGDQAPEFRQFFIKMPNPPPPVSPNSPRHGARPAGCGRHEAHLRGAGRRAEGRP